MPRLLLLLRSLLLLMVIFVVAFFSCAFALNVVKTQRDKENILFLLLRISERTIQLASFDHIHAVFT